MDPKSSPLTSPIAPTLETVAKAAGVARSTASRALRNSPLIAAATRREIQAIASRLGYRPNPYVSVLMAHVRQTRPAPYTATIAWVDRLPGHAWRENRVQRQFYSGAVAHAGTLGFHLERVACGGAKFSRARLTDMLRARGIKGVLCSADTPDSRFLELPLDVSSFAVATVGCRFTKPDLHFSTNDQFVTASTAHRRLLALGYRRIGFVTTHGLEEIVDHRFSGGYLSVLANKNRPLSIPVHFFDERDHRAFPAWLRKHRPDAVLTTHLRETLGQIRAAGLRVPEDLGFAMLDWDETNPEVAGIRQNHARVGAGAVDLVVSQVRRNEFGVPSHAQGVLIEGDWVDGATAPPRHGDKPRHAP